MTSLQSTCTARLFNLYAVSYNSSGLWRRVWGNKTGNTVTLETVLGPAFAVVTSSVVLRLVPWRVLWQAWHLLPHLFTKKPEIHLIAERLAGIPRSIFGFSSSLPGVFPWAVAESKSRTHLNSSLKSNRTLFPHFTRYNCSETRELTLDGIDERHTVNCAICGLITHLNRRQKFPFQSTLSWSLTFPASVILALCIGRTGYRGFADNPSYPEATHQGLLSKSLREWWLHYRQEAAREACFSVTQTLKCWQADITSQ